MNWYFAAVNLCNGNVYRRKGHFCCVLLCCELLMMEFLVAYEWNNRWAPLASVALRLGNIDTVQQITYLLSLNSEMK